MDAITWILIGTIAVLIFVVIAKNDKIKYLKDELKRAKQDKSDLQKEYSFYYLLAETLWDKYREFEIFPSKLVREINKRNGW